MEIRKSGRKPLIMSCWKDISSRKEAEGGDCDDECNSRRLCAHTHLNVRADRLT